VRLQTHFPGNNLGRYLAGELQMYPVAFLTLEAFKILLAVDRVLTPLFREYFPGSFTVKRRFELIDLLPCIGDSSAGLIRFRHKDSNVSVSCMEKRFLGT
jgi:hypothetical protein